MQLDLSFLIQDDFGASQCSSAYNLTIALPGYTLLMLGLATPLS